MNEADSGHKQDASGEWSDQFSPHMIGRNHGGNALSSVAIALEAWRRGLEVTFESDDLERYIVSDGYRSIEFNCSRPESITDREAFLRLNRKYETSSTLRANGIPAPEAVSLDLHGTSDSRLRNLAEQLGYPLVLKPDTGSLGNGVLVGLSNWDELKAGFEHLKRSFKPQRLILERHHVGDDYRILVVGDEVVGAARRVPAHVVGDGHLSIAELIEEKNTQRKKNPFLASGRLKIDREVDVCLRDQGVALDDVPSLNRLIRLRRIANASAGGDIVDVTDELPEEIKSAAVQAVRAFPRILISGVDVIYDATSTSGTRDFVIIELNARPHIGLNMYPSHGKGRDVPGPMIDFLFPGTQRIADPAIKTLRFNVGGVRTALRSRVASRITLPILPSHLYPYRCQYLFPAPWSAVDLSIYIRKSIQQCALRNGAVGSVGPNANGKLTLRVAAKERAQTEAVLRRVEESTGLKPTSNGAWRGTVTDAFTIDQ